MEELSKDRNAQEVRREFPIETVFRSRFSLLRPQDPRRKHAIEESLDESRAEEMFTLVAVELNSEGFFECFAN